MVVLKKVGVLSIAKIQSILMIVIGFFLGIFYAIIAASVDKTEYATDPLVMLGWWSIILMPIIYGIMGFVIGAIGAWLYNLIAKKIGGVEIELSK